MIEMAGELMETGQRVRVHGTVYFDVASFPRYGELSRYSRDEMIRLGREPRRQSRRSPSP